ncbi:penicillin-binding protein 2 [candidate division KSB1 bacterium]|nr:penicillin-binding protein 2 [candidate division KSB1 bacterium]
MVPLEKKNIYSAALIILFAILLTKLFHLQIYEWGKYLQYSEKNRIRQVRLLPTRGLIYDRHGYVLVDNTPSYSVSVFPFEYLKNDSSQEKIADLVGVHKDIIDSKIRQSTSPFLAVRVASNISFDTLVKIQERSLELPWIIINVEPTRMYSGDIFASHLFGYLGEISRAELKSRQEYGLVQGDYVGKKGIEKFYDDELRGKAGHSYVEVDALGREVGTVQVDRETQPEPGADIYLTIDLELQKLAEKLFEKKSGGVVLLDVRTGGVLVLCSKPDYNPEIFTQKISNEIWRSLVNSPQKVLYDRMIQSEYPPGSTFKLVLAAAGLETRQCNISETTDCQGYINLGIHTFHCWNTSGHGQVDFLDAIKRSCNVYFYRMSLKVDVDDWARHSRLFGFGQPTGIDLVGESSGNVPDRAYLNAEHGENGWGKGMLFNLAIGQGELLVTPIQMAQFAMILANKGLYVQPHLLHRFYYMHLKEFRYHQPLRKQIQNISQNTWQVLQKGMIMAVNESGGTGLAASLPYVSIAGKTGTAENPHGEAHAWFIGFGPAQNPQVAICVLVENGGSGGAQAAPIAREIFDKYFEIENRKQSFTIITDDTDAKI